MLPSYPTLDSFSAFASPENPTVTLTSGEIVLQSDVVPLANGRFGQVTDDGTVIDITSYLNTTQQQQFMRLWANQKLTPLPTSTLQILGNQLYNDPFNAPIAQAGKILGGAGQAITKQVVGSSGLQQLLFWGALGFAVYFFWPRLMKSR